MKFPGRPNPLSSFLLLLLLAASSSSSNTMMIKKGDNNFRSSPKHREEEEEEEARGAGDHRRHRRDEVCKGGVRGKGCTTVVTRYSNGVFIKSQPTNTTTHHKESDDDDDDERRICQNWDSQLPQTHHFIPSDGYPGLHSNTCADPSGGANGKPWCFTTTLGVRWKNCKYPTRTKSGKTCQHWYEDFPHSHIYHGKAWGVVGNYCLDPNGRGKLWCYTTDPKTEWEEC